MAMEVKVYYRKKKTRQIDHIPNCFQLPRSAYASKPRTEFNLPLCSFKVELDLHSSTEIQSSVTVGCSEMSNDTIKGTVDLPSTRSTAPKRRRQKTLTNGTKVPVTNPKSFEENAHLQPCSNRKFEDGDGNATPLELTPNRPQLTENCEEFHYKKQPRSYKESSSSPDGPDCERDNSSSSSLAGTGSTVRARSQRERKRKVHFDEVTCPLYTSRKVRRFKIMRFLGLAAPVGSPFNSS